MTPHRLSFWKTIVPAAGAGAIAGGIAAWAATHPSIAYRCAAVAAALAATAGLVVAAGGLVALWLDGWEGRPSGDPLEPSGRRRLEAAPLPALPAGRPPVTRAGGFRVGDTVLVRSREEILRTLDGRGALDGLPFMPEMLRYCGREFRVFRRVDKINDMIQKTGLRRMRDAVTLEGVRCDGLAHGGCEAGCQIVWKEAWLEPADGRAPVESTDPDAAVPAVLADGVHPPAASDDVWACQITEMRRATSELGRWDVRQDLRPLVAGNVGPRDYLVALLVRLFNQVQWWRGGAMYPAMPPGARDRTPEAVLNLQPGELVRVKSREAIAATLDAGDRNRGMRFDREMIRFCGRTFRVLRRVTHIIDERNGRMLHLRNSCIVLEGVTATGEFLRFCPQNEHVFWREIWLERVVEPADS